MKDRCLFNIYHDRNTNKEVVEYGVPCSSINDNCIELWERPDGSQYMVLYSGGDYSKYDWLTVQLAVLKVSMEKILRQEDTNNEKEG